MRNPNTMVKSQRGATIVVVGILLTILIGFAAISIDVGYLYLTRNQLQNVADAAALAGARQLGSIYQNMTYSSQSTYTCDSDDMEAIRTAALDVALQNRAAGDSVQLNITDVVVGRWDEWRVPGVQRNENIHQPDAVHVIARRDGHAASGPVNTFFANILGVPTVNVTASATAALSGMGTAEPGELELPVGISEAWFQKGGFCGEEIKFYPADSCAGWTGFDKNPNTPNMRDILGEKVESPAVIAGVTKFEFTGGVSATLYENNNHPDITELFNKKATWVDEYGNPTTEGNGTLVWSTTVVVYKHPEDKVVDGVAECKNPNSSYTIVGFARIDLTEVGAAPDKVLKGTITCDYVNEEDTRGGGANYGLKGSIPGLVE